MASSSTVPKRAVGRGRVIGVAAATKPSSSSDSSHLKPPPLASPSDSSLSLSSQVSQSKSSTDETDISSAITLQAASGNVPTTGSTATGRLMCPICSEEMVTLLQLNRHLDDVHRDMEDEEQDEVKTWFKTQMLKAKKFQPLAVLNQKLKGLDVFEANEDRKIQPPATVQNQHVAAGTGPQTQTPTIVDTDELVTREHWQRYTKTGECSDPMCGKRLGASNGNINCRSCGKLFCEEHTMYQMKLSRSAKHEPVRGFWCRVCETCYKSRDGYNDHHGVEREHFKSFASLRRQAVDKKFLEVSRLEKRLTKLTQLLVDPRLDQEQGVSGYLWSVAGYKNQKRTAEESIVEWEDDAKISHCPFCKQDFSNYTFRRHHCRLCGRVVCGDVNTDCSTPVPLDVAAPVKTPEEKPGRVAVDVRMCKDCRHTIFSKSDFDRAASVAPPDQRAFGNLKEFERGIRMLLPRFQKLLTALQDPDHPPSPAQLTEASRVRKLLTDSFTQYDVAARRIRDMPTESPTQQRLQRQVHAAASSFLHVHMLPLKSLPKILKHASPHGHGRSASNSSVATVNGHLSPHVRDRGPLAAIKNGVASGDSSSQVSGTSRLSTLESEEKQLREQLIVLEEQKFMVSEMVADAQRRRKFEEVESLGRNMQDLGVEIDRIQGMLENIRSEVTGLYISGNEGLIV